MKCNKVLKECAKVIEYDITVIYVYFHDFAKISKGIVIRLSVLK